MRDYVVPVVELSREGDGVAIARFRGTAFLVGASGCAVTAEHVVAGHAGLLGILLVDADGRWTARIAREVTVHPVEDAAVLVLEGEVPDSPLVLAGSWQGSGCRWDAWGYPEDIQREVVVDGVAVMRPDLVFLSGYIRRRLADVQLAVVRGSAFYELSELGGSGFSGGPLVIIGPDLAWRVVGIYVAERYAEGGGPPVAYAVRIADIYDWLIGALGRSG